MKNISLIIILSFFTIVSNAQSRTTKKMLAEIEGQWSLDDNGNVSYLRIIEVPELSKEKIYTRALSYFIYNYGSGKSVIETKDKELGTIIGKGLYKNIHISESLLTTYINCWHVTRVDVKEGRARVILTLTTYDKNISDGLGYTSNSSVNVKQSFPINPKALQRTVMGKTFYKSHLRAILTLDSIEKAIKEGNTSKSLETDDW
ncbi:DUF4468 domain-containing protein [Tamlana sp. s12]|uniref:DUF4468 domain-containing protein n=1 Tax=Tamlana sp. s12 TaxID=1630406 RepID=UPI0007FDACC0|nr:DUF4468 domain-containing protein [Tamlana sp. s12]OBQ52897.1 hypothetical protein VQ01_13190 [Tamlana sp. s12]QQY81076.1 DUF4468 domain-containing protein [Tamlana sp. s12]